MRDAKDKDRQRAQQEEVKHPQYDVRQLLAEQEFAAGGWRHVQVDNRSELFLTHYAQGAEHRRIIISSSGITAGTMAGRLFTSGL